MSMLLCFSAVTPAYSAKGAAPSTRLCDRFRSQPASHANVVTEFKKLVRGCRDKATAWANASGYRHAGQSAIQ